jgi:hypothetical protein
MPRYVFTPAAGEKGFLEPVDDLVADATTTAPGVGLAAAANGQRYVLQSHATALHANWGTISGVSNNDVIVCVGPAGGLSWQIAWDASSHGAGALVWDKSSSLWYEFDGSSWVVHGGPAVYYVGTTSYAGTQPTAAEMAAFLTAVNMFGHFKKGATDPVFYAHRHSVAAGGLDADFSFVELT